MMNLKNINNKKASSIKSNLLKKFDQFVYEVIEDRQLVKFSRELKSGTKVAIFGGMLRDFSLFSRKDFSSDIDLVVQAQTNTNLINILKNYPTEINAFGGLRVKVGRWMFDIWHIENTWAFKKGLVKENSFQSLVNTTFFNWDAILLELDNKNRKIYCKKSYFKELGSRYLTINLEENPNPKGVVFRSLKHFIVNDAFISYKLAKYIIDKVNIIGKQDFIHDFIKMKENNLTPEMINMAFEQLNEFVNDNSNGSVNFSNPQLEMNFDTIKDSNENVLYEVDRFENNLSRNIDIKYVKEQISMTY